MHILQAWETKDDSSFEQALRNRENGPAASSEAMISVIALRASQKLILWKYIFSQLPA